MQENAAEKLNRIQSLFDAGKSHAEIAKELGYSNIKSFYRYIYRYNDNLHYAKLFDKKSLSVVPQREPQTKQVEKAVEVKTKTKENMSKAESIVSLIGRGMDIREVAQKKNFKGIQELADYMKSKGYNWNSDVKNYIFVWQVPQIPLEQQVFCNEQEPISGVGSTENKNFTMSDQYEDVLKWLISNRENIQMLLNTNDISHRRDIPRYMLPGVLTTKTFNMVQPLKELIIEFAQETNVQQKEIFEVAIIEFLIKYGFKDKVKMILKI